MWAQAISPSSAHSSNKRSGYSSTEYPCPALESQIFPIVISPVTKFGGGGGGGGDLKRNSDLLDE